MSSLSIYGFKVERHGDAARLTIRDSVFMQGVIVIVAIGGLAILGFVTADWGFPGSVPPWAVWSVAVLVALGLVYSSLFHRTLITIRGSTLAVERRPISLPRPYRVQLSDIGSVNTDVKVTTRRDSDGDEHETYTFTVQLSLKGDYRPKKLYSTGSEAAAVVFRQTLVMMIENARAASDTYVL